MNTGTLTLYPYLESGTWVFDDERTGLKEEAFVLGATEMITAIVAAKGIPDAERGFALTFSGRPFEGHDVRLVWQRRDPSGSGNWYAGEVAGGSRSAGSAPRCCSTLAASAASRSTASPRSAAIPATTTRAANFKPSSSPAS